MTHPAFLSTDSRFHHVGVACRSIARELSALRGLGYRPVGEPFADPRQGVSGVFLEGIGPRLELLEPLPDDETLLPWLRGKAKLYHLAYEVSNLDQTLDAAGRFGARQVSPPVASVAFDNRRISFTLLPTMLLVELIDSPAH